MDGERIVFKPEGNNKDVLHGEQYSTSDLDVSIDADANLKTLIKQRDSLINQLCTKIMNQNKVIQELEVELKEKKSEIHKLRGEISLYNNDKTAVIELLKKMKTDIADTNDKPIVNQDSKGIIKRTNDEIHKTVDTIIIEKNTKSTDKIIQVDLNGFTKCSCRDLVVEKNAKSVNKTTQADLNELRKCTCRDLEEKINSCKKNFKNLKGNYKIIINTNIDLRDDIKKLMDENKTLINALRHEQVSSQRELVQKRQIKHEATKRYFVGFNNDTYNIEEIMKLKERTIYHLEMALQKEKDLNSIFVKLLKHVL